MIQNLKYADMIGVVSSTACAIHCAILPMLLITGTMIPAFLSNELFHEVMIALIIPSALLSFTLGCQRHKSRSVFAFGVAGLFGMVVPFLTELSEMGEQVVVLLSAAALITAHAINYRLCKSSNCRA